MCSEPSVGPPFSNISTIKFSRSQCSPFPLVPQGFAGASKQEKRLYLFFPQVYVGRLPLPSRRFTETTVSLVYPKTESSYLLHNVESEDTNSQRVIRLPHFPCLAYQRAVPLIPAPHQRSSQNRTVLPPSVTTNAFRKSDLSF